MRNVFCRSLIGLAKDPAFVFLTGDLGFQALEPLREAAGPRFLNAGLAEQNMVSAAAGMAWTGLKPWVYSIAPFVYARPYEQIRNDVCMHDLPVRLVGNGGGYGYGVMGATHHALGDYGALLCLDHLCAFVPAFAADVRLGRCELPQAFTLPAYAPWRCLLRGGGATIAVAGPLAGGILDAACRLPERQRPNFWVIAELPIQAETVPTEFLQDLRNSGHLVAVEEHIAQGGLGQMLAHALLRMGQPPARFTHCCAKGYPSGRYGSQKYHRKECGLDPQSILAELGT